MKNPYLIRDLNDPETTGQIAEFADAKSAFEIAGRLSARYRHVVVQQWAPSSSGSKQLYVLIEWRDGHVVPPDWCTTESERQ